MRLLLLLVLSLNSGIFFAQVLPLEDCFNGIDDDGDGYVDCYDVDCPCFDPPACATLIPPNTGISMQEAWKGLNLPGIFNGVAILGNMNPQTDSMPEIILLSDHTIVGDWNVKFYRGDGSNANTPDSLKLVKNAQALAEPLIGDVDNDGSPELIVVESDFYIRVYRNFTPGASPVMSHWITSTNKVQMAESRPMLADMDGDGTPEIVVDNEVFIFDFTDPVNPKLRKVLDAGSSPSGQQFYSLGYVPSSVLASPAVADLLSVADCNGDPDCAGLEIAAGPVIYSIDLDTMDGDGYQIKIQRDLNLLESPDVFGDGFTAVADMNIDGIPDVVVLGRGKVGLDPAKLGVYVWNKNGLLRYMNISVQDSIWGRFYTLPMIANVFDDTKRGLAKDFPEIVFSTSTNLYCYNLHAINFPDLSVWWFLPLNNPAFYHNVTATAFDFNGDGFSEIVFGDNQNLRIIYGGHYPFPAGVSADRNWASTPFVQNGVGFTRYPVVADVDNDGQAEIIEIGRETFIPDDYAPAVHVFETAGLPWPPCRNVWNQYNYNIVNVDDDLGIPVQQQQHWKELPVPGSGKRPLNMALGQRGPINGAVYLPLADLNSVVDSFYCDKDSLRLRLKVCNQGSTASPAGLSLQWYQGNPTAAGALKYGTPYVFPSVIAKDACAFWDLAVPLPPNGTFYGIINDNGSVSGPIDLATDFPSTSLIECDYTNNLFSINVSYSSPILDLGPDRMVCKAATVLLDAGAGFVVYQWSDGSTDSTFTAHGVGKYWVDAWDICGNLFSDTLVLSAIPTPPLVLGPDQSLCLGDSISWSTAGFDQLNWTASDGTNCVDCPVFSATPGSDLTIWAVGQSGTCFERDTISIQVLPLPQVDGQVTDTHCGNQDGAINILVNSILPYQIQWAGGQTVPVLSNLAAASYTVTVTDDAGCSSMETYAVAGSTPLMMDVPVLTPVLCFGELTGQISVGVNSGTAPYQYNWSTGPGDAVLNNLAAGNYSLTVTDDLGCTSANTFLITQPQPLVIQSIVDATSCISTTGNIDLTPQGGTGTYSYNWNTGQNTSTLTSLAPGTYTVTVNDANACTSIQTFVFTPGGAPVLSAPQIIPVGCFGENTGQISVQASAGLPPYQFNWSTGPGANALDNLPAGTYGLTITDANGCTASNQFLVDEPPPLQLKAIVDSSSCTSTTGDIDVTPQGGTTPYVFAWNNGQNTPSVDDLLPGTYTLTLSDAKGCKTVQIFDIEPGGTPVISDSLLTDVRCFGENMGAIAVTATLGVPPYQFNWSNGAGTNTLINLLAGAYTVTVTDVNGCSISADFILNQPGAITLFADIDSTSCTSSTGNISVTGQGGIAPFGYLWNGGQNTPALDDLNPGTYTVTITDANGCTIDQDFTLAPGGAPVLSGSETIPVSCAGENNGQITVDINGGVPPYDFLWSTGSTDSLISSLPAGNYTFTATGANGCVTTVQFSVGEPAPLALIATVDSTSCTSNTGNILVTPQGGVSPFTFLWNGGQNTPALNDLQPGDYSVTATDANGCTTTNSISIEPGGSPAVTNNTVIPATCFGTTTGQISVAIAGGALPYQFNWSTGPGADSLSNLPAGTYSLTVTDANTCTSTASFTVGTPPLLEITFTAAGDTCGQNTGALAVNTSGGTAPYTYLWSNGAVTEDLNGLAPGALQLTVTDANACTDIQNAEVFSMDNFPVFTLTGDTITCVQAIVTAGALPAPADWSFQWKSPDGNVLNGPVQGLHLPGTYSVTATNALGCTAVQILDILIDTLRPQALVAATELFIPCGQSSVLLDGSGASSGAFFAAHWYTENNGQIVWDTIALVGEANQAGTFILQITDTRNGCTDYDTTQVTVAEPIAQALIDVDSISCFGLADGVIRIKTVTGGTAPYTYSINNQAFSSNSNFNNLSAGTYTISILDAGGCSWQSGGLLVGEPAPLSLNLSASDTRIDQGEKVLLQAIVQPPDAVLSQIQWSPTALFSFPLSLNETVQPLETTLFQIEVEDQNGCTASDTARVSVRREAIYLPNVFQPGQPGNDALTVFAGADIREVQLLRVYDRWGEHLFENRHFAPNDLSQGWDGSYRGKPVAPGVYIVYGVVEMVDGRTVEVKGSVTVAR